MKHAFSLVELSIVLVILGLLMGGILTGQNLIRAAELRSVTTEFNKYQTAVMTFKDKYLALPGDMTNATAFWGELSSTPNTCRDTASTTPATCNGDGNGKVNSWVATWETPAGSNEAFRFWQHLANAGLIEGTYTGSDAGTGYRITTSANAPSGKLSNSLWFVWHFDNSASMANGFSKINRNSFMFGATKANELPEDAIMSPVEMWNIDKKVDDGRPGYGSIVPQARGNCTTAATAVDYDADYKITESTNYCSIIFREAF